MTPEEFEASFDETEPPNGLSAPLSALWHSARGGWDLAHRLVQDDAGVEAAWVHAYLHRVEGDASNAAYWYGRAGRPVADGALADERRAIAEDLLAKQV